jgi:hypothetical protein
VAELDNHTLRVLREFREEFAAFRAETRDNFANISDRLDDLAQVIAGEMITRRHTDASVEARLSAIEKRVAAIEESR